VVGRGFRCGVHCNFGGWVWVPAWVHCKIGGWAWLRHGIHYIFGGWAWVLAWSLVVGFVLLA
jgi:hypothetical protein